MEILYVGLNWLFCLATAAILVVCFLRYRHLFIKPSFVILAFFHVQIQWAGTAKSAEIYQYLPEPTIFILLLHGFPLLGLALSFFTFHGDSKLLLRRITAAEDLKVNKNVLFTLLFLTAFIVIIYFFTVPFTRTGLYAIIHDPLTSKFAREKSLKLVENDLVRYSFIFLRGALVPILFTFFSFLTLFAVRRKRLLRAALYLAVMLLLLIIVSISGARSPALFVILTALFAFYLRQGMKIRLLYVVLLTILLPTIPTVISILRAGQPLTPDLYWTYLSNAIARRIFVVPMNVALYHVHFAQTYGFLGVAAVPKLAALFNVDSINAANFIFVKYMYFGLESGLANACYVFTYYSYFGILSFPVSLLGLWMLDAAIPVFKRIRNSLVLIAAIAATFNASLAFVRSDYTTALISGGFFLILLAAFVLDRIDSRLPWLQKSVI